MSQETEPQNTELWLIRHGESESNRNGEFQGWGATPLSPLGRAQAARLADYLRSRHAFDALYSSDLVRAAETAEYLQQALGLPLRTDERLRELDFGEWSGRTFEEIRERYEAEWTNPPRFDPSERRGGGESFYELQARVVPALNEIALRHAGENVLIVCHGGPIRVYLAHLLGAPLSEMWHMTIANTGISRVRPLEHIFSSSGRPGKVLTLNDVGHLVDLEVAEETD